MRPTPRALRWFKHIERHGPQSSEFLYELTRDTHRCKDTALRDLQKLRAGGFLQLPKQQRATERAEFNPYIYDLTRQAHDHLKGLGLAEITVRLTGHWWHAYTVSAFTGSLDIVAQRNGNTFIPAHEILERNGAELAIPLHGGKVIPDQLFAIRYPEGFRAFMLEVDRGTEPIQSGAARKSLAKSVEQYSQLLNSDAHRRHYDLRANTLILWVFNNPARMVEFQNLLQARCPAQAPSFLCKVVPFRLSWENLQSLHQAAWVSANDEAVDGV
ncbi:MAG: replication-relaxation family protein [Pseudomonadota bacterium]